jgi:hypothetical protein
VTNAQLIERVSLQAKLLIRAAVFYDIWRVHSDPQTRGAYIDTMNEYSEYFLFNESVYLSSTINAIYSLTENRPDTLNILASVKMVEERLSERATEIDQIRQEYRNANDKLEKIAILRNNVFAHRSAKLTYEATFEKVQMTPNDVRDSLTTCLGALNALLSLLGADKVEFRELPRDDFVAMLDDLMMHHGKPVDVF